MLSVRIQKSLQKDPVLLPGKTESKLEWGVNVYCCIIKQIGTYTVRYTGYTDLIHALCLALAQEANNLA